MATKIVSAPAFVLDPNHELTEEEKQSGGDHFVEIKTLLTDPARARLALDKEMEMLAPHVERVRLIAIYLGLEVRFAKELLGLGR
jgi:hypothetical protein